jgi:hypothetical protein
MHNASTSSKEARIQLTLQAIEQGQFNSIRRAAKTYDVPESTIRDRRAGRLPRAEMRPSQQKLTEIEEEVIVTYVLDLAARGYPPILNQVRDMADRLLTARGARKVGKN